jgi:hypothetical protein
MYVDKFGFTYMSRLFDPRDQIDFLEVKLLS